MLGKVGAHRYARDPRTEILCVAFAVDNEPVKLWLPGDAVPPEFIEAANNPNWIVVAHNAAFEREIEQHILGPRFGWPLIPIERQRCTMAMALALSLPAKLENVARALALRHQKDDVGHRLMLMMAKPRKARRDEDPDRHLLVRGSGSSRAPVRVLSSMTSKPSVNCTRELPLVVGIGTSAVGS